MKHITLLAFLAFASTTTIFAQKSETRSLSGFQTIGISGGFEKVTLKQGNTESIEIKSDKISTDQITTDVKDGKLKIDIKNSRRGWDSGDIELVITYKSIEAVHNSGSSNVEIVGELKAKRFDYHLSGSGNISGTFDVDELKVHISGSGNATLDGTADVQEYHLSGSGNIEAEDLKGNSAEVRISGSGNVDLNVDGKVRTSVSGSGNVSNKKGK